MLSVRTLSAIEAHNFAVGAPIEEVIQVLVDRLGLTLVAAIGGVSETRAVAQWLQNRKPQRPQVLRFSLQLALMVAASDDPATVRAWFQGSNPHLGDTSPALLLRNRPLEEVQEALMHAAREFAARVAPE